MSLFGERLLPSQVECFQFKLSESWPSFNIPSPNTRPNNQNGVQFIAHHCSYTDVSKNRVKTTKMDCLFHGKPYEQMDDLGVFQLFLETPIFYTKQL